MNSCVLIPGDKGQGEDDGSQRAASGNTWNAIDYLSNYRDVLYSVSIQVKVLFEVPVHRNDT